MGRAQAIARGGLKAPRGAPSRSLSCPCRLRDNTGIRPRAAAVPGVAGTGRDGERDRLIRDATTAVALAFEAEHGKARENDREAEPPRRVTASRQALAPRLDRGPATYCPERSSANSAAMRESPKKPARSHAWAMPAGFSAGQVIVAMAPCRLRNTLTSMSGCGGVVPSGQCLNASGGSRGPVPEGQSTLTGPRCMPLGTCRGMIQASRRITLPSWTSS